MKSFRLTSALGALLLGTLVQVAWLSQPLSAEDGVPRAVQEDVAQLWLEGRPERIEAAIEPYRDTPEGLLAHQLLRRLWRPPSLRVSQDLTSPGLFAAFEKAGLYDPASPLPESVGGGQDPYPVVTALLRDRSRRETRGAVGLPAESPIVLLAQGAELPDPQGELIEAASYWMQVVYTGRYPDDPEFDAEQKRIGEVAQGLEDRNTHWALISLALFLLVPLGIGWQLGRRPEPERGS